MKYRVPGSVSVELNPIDADVSGRMTFTPGGEDREFDEPRSSSRLRNDDRNDDRNDREQILRDRLELEQARVAALREVQQPPAPSSPKINGLRREIRALNERLDAADQRNQPTPPPPSAPVVERQTHNFFSGNAGLLGLLGLLGIGYLAFGRDNNGGNLAAAAAPPPPAAAAPVCPPGMTCTPVATPIDNLAMATNNLAGATSQLAAANNRGADASFKDVECREKAGGCNAPASNGNRGSGHARRPSVPTYANTIINAAAPAPCPEGRICIMQNTTFGPGGAGATGSGTTLASTGPVLPPPSP